MQLKLLNVSQTVIFSHNFISPFQAGGGSFLGKDESCFDELTLRSTNTTPTISGLTMLKEAHLTMLFLKLGLSLS